MNENTKSVLITVPAILVMFGAAAYWSWLSVQPDPGVLGMWYEMPDWWVAIFTFALVLVTGGLWFATFRMWRTTQQAVNDGAAAITAAKRSAIAAEDALLHSRESSALQLQAYIFPKPVEIQDFETAPKVTISFENFGKTPAYEVVLWVTTGICIFPLEKEADQPLGSPNTSNGPLAPGDVIHRVIELPPISDIEKNGIKDRECALYLFGGINYVDAFKKPRFVRFCYIRGGPHDSYDGDGPMAVYRIGNYSDFNTD
jgi:hypothetical protein